MILLFLLNIYIYNGIYKWYYYFINLIKKNKNL